MLTPGPSSDPTPTSLQGKRNSTPKVSARETMAAWSLQRASKDGNVDGVRQALAAGPAPQSRGGEHEAAKEVCWGGSFGGLTVFPFLSPVTLSFHFLLLLRGSSSASLDSLSLFVSSRPQLCAFFPGAEVNHADGHGPAPGASCVLLVPFNRAF